MQALHDLLIQVVQPPSEHRRERLSVPLVLIATSGLLSSLSILFVVSTIVGVLSVVIAAVVRRYVQQATKEACVRECEERSEAFCFCYDKPKIHIMQLTKHPPTWAASFIITHQRHHACIRRASITWRREETQATIWSAHGGSIAVRAKRAVVKHISSHQLAEVRVEIWLVVADAHTTYTFKLGCAQLLEL